MRIYYDINFNKSANPADANVSRKSSEKNIKDITVANVLKKSLNVKEKYNSDNNLEFNINQFLNDFSKSNIIQMMYLDTTGKEIRNFEKVIENNNVNKHVYKNIVFLGKNSEVWNDDSAAIFTDLTIQKSNKSNNYDFIFDIKRIEFLELSELYDCDNSKIIKLNEIEFVEYNKKNNDIYSNSEIELIDKLKYLKKINNIFDNNSNDVNKFNVWFKFIKLINNIIDKIQGNEKHFLFAINDLTTNELFDNNIEKILITKSNNLNESQLNFLTSSYDESINCKIKCILKERKPNNNKFEKIINNQIEKYNQRIKENELNLESYCKNNNINNNKIIENNNAIIKYKNEIDDIDKKIDVIFIDDKNNKKIKEFENEINEKNREINFLFNNIDVIKNDILNNEKIIKKLDSEINNFKKNIEVRKKFINNFIEKKYNAFFISIKNDNTNNESVLNEFNISKSKFDFNEIESDNSKLFYISENFAGLNWKIKRYRNALSNAASGYYKNPYLIYSIQDVPRLNYRDSISESIKNKYKLNKYQQRAVNGVLSTLDTYYLQGPPGTGKTQTICAITEEIISKNKNILMTSSTHEAISNFLERLSSNNETNPNVIIFKYSYIDNQNKITPYSEQTLYNTFVDKMYNYIRINALKISKNEIKELFESIDNDIYNTFDFKNKFYINEKILSNILNKTSLNDLEQNVINHLKDISDEFVEFNGYKNNIEIIYILWKKENKHLVFDNSQIEIIDKIYDKLDNQYLSFKQIEHFLKNDNNDLFFNKILKFLEKNNNLSNTKHENDFLEYIAEKNLINVIGITTTARTKFSILNKDYDLFVDYPIDMVIIDEISKSSTPEILARAILSKKVIFCGDYRQLPPSSDVDISFADKLILNSDNKMLENLESIFSISFDRDNDNNSKKLSNAIELLYQKSFFSNQVNELKRKNNNEDNAYNFLKVQHRFSESIMDMVNINYDYDEKLEMGKPNEFFELNQYELKINNISYKRYDTLMVDTTLISSNYKKRICEILNINLSNLNYAFDQKEPIFFNEKSKSTGCINEYNAYVCEKICESLVNENLNKIFNKIGIICLTTNQKNTLKKVINSNRTLKDKKIKIDTIDNFQGKEKEIIIVDFVRAKNSYENKKIIEFNDRLRNLDFISNENRNNVALSRAKNKLILVGAFEYYENPLNSKYKINWLTSEYNKNVKNKIKWSENDN